MKILFVENRYKTVFFAEVAKRLQAKGHEVHWLVQNHLFRPKGEGFILHIIPYPNQHKEREINKDEAVEKVISSDRQINFFKLKNQTHFYYYYERISEEICQLKPDIVFGESTAFHELLTVEVCRKEGVHYLHPTSCRYPKERFSFYIEDTLVPYKGSAENMGANEAIEIIESISERKAKPDYLKKVKKKRITIIKDKVKILSSYWSGEKYNTPSPWVKFVLEKRKKTNIALWDNLAVDRIQENGKVNILYPLHMQPEANIDVWGRKYRDQFKLIKDLSALLVPHCNFYVKPNPKSKYELSDELLNFLSAAPVQAIPIKHSVSMDDIFSEIDLFITVTGTVAIECILANKPVVTLVNTLNNENKNCIYLKNLNDILGIIEKVTNNTFPKIGVEEKIEFINTLNRTSYEGVISDPINNPDCLGPENLDKVTDSFEHLLEML